MYIAVIFSFLNHSSKTGINPTVWKFTMTVVESLNHAWVFATPWTPACQASLSFISWSLLKLMSVELMVSSNHVFLYHPVLLLPSVFPSIRDRMSSLGTSAPHHYPTCFCGLRRPPAIVSKQGMLQLFRLRMRKQRMLLPGSWGAYQRSEFHKPRLLHPPIYIKVLSSLIWGMWFSLINSNLSSFPLSGLCRKTPISWLSPYLFGAVSQSSFWELWFQLTRVKIRSEEKRHKSSQKILDRTFCFIRN